MSDVTKKEKGFFATIERLGNKIPDPVVFFLFLIVFIVIASGIMSSLGVREINPSTNEEVEIYNLLSKDGLTYMLNSVTDNWKDLAVMTLTLTTMLGMGVADHSGLFECIMRRVTLNAKGKDTKVIFVFVVIAALADITNGPGFVIMPMLGAIVWKNLKRNPLAGMICGYATVAGAFAANFLLGTTDITCAAFTEAAAQLLVDNYHVNVAMNYFFTFFSIITLVAASVYITIKVVEPRLGKYNNEIAEGTLDKDDIYKEYDNESKALKYAGISALIYIIVIVALCLMPDSIMLGEADSLLVSGSTLMKGLTFFLALLFFIPGYVFGRVTKQYKGFEDAVVGMTEGIRMMAGFIVLCFFIAQFLAYFSKTNIGLIIAIKGAHLLEVSGLPISIVLVLFILFCSILNLFIGSASAKWGVIAPVFVPMVMLLGYNPAVAQLCYRIGDAITNPITPSFAYMGMLLALAKKYDKTVGFGTIISNLMPYTILFSVILIVQFLIWFLLGIPLGFGGAIRL